MKSQSQSIGTALITGASSGIGAGYAEQLARRGHNLILVARDGARLHSIAVRLQASYGVSVSTVPADLNQEPDLQRISQLLQNDSSISLIVNSAGIGPEGPSLSSSHENLEAMLHLNVLALHRLTMAAANAFVSRKNGSIINIASVVAFIPERFNPSYSATKAFVLALTQGLNSELAPHGIKIQAVLPGLTRTEIFDRAGFDMSVLDPNSIMDVSDLVKAALSGFDQGELVTIPSLEDPALWQSFEASRGDLGPHLSRSHPAKRYVEMN